MFRPRLSSPLPSAFAVVLLAAVPTWAHHPHDVVTAFAISPDFPVDPAVLVASFDTGNVKAFKISRDHGRSWVSTGAGLTGGDVRDVAFADHWSTSGVAYAATAFGGLQRTDDGAATWAPVGGDDHLRLLAVGPGGPAANETVFFATADSLFSWSPLGGDRRLLWEAPTPLDSITALEVSPTFDLDSTVAFATNEILLHVSHDGGRTFVSSRPYAFVNRIRFSPRHAKDGILWLATEGAGVLATRDDGQTFVPLRNGLSDWRVNDVVPSRRYPTCPDLFAATADSGVYVSHDQGATWSRTPLQTIETYQTDSHYRRLALSPDYPNRPFVYCGTFEGLFLSTDGGDHWYQSNIKPTRMGTFVEVSPTYAADSTAFYIGYGMPIVASEDGGDTWEPRLTGFNSTTGTALAISPTFASDSLVMVGVQHGVRRSTDAGRSWQSIWFSSRDSLPANKVQAVVFSPDFDRDSTVFAVGVHGIYRSHDRGVSWVEDPPVRELQSELAFSPDFAVDSTFFIAGKGGYGVLKTTDGGRTFSEPTFVDRAGATNLVLADDFPVSGEMYCLSGAEGVYRSTDAGATWAAVNQGLGGAYPTALAMARGFSLSRVLVVGTAGEGIFRSTSVGAPVWEQLTPTDSPVATINDLAIVPDYPADPTIFAATAEGIWRSTDDGQTWTLQTDREVYDDDREDPWVWGGDWQKRVMPGTINYSVRASRTPGAAANFSFYGRRVLFYGTRGPNHGVAAIAVDGRQVVEFDAYAPEVAAQVVMLDQSWPEPGYHTVRLRVTGGRNTSSTDAWVTVDAAEVVYR